MLLIFFHIYIYIYIYIDMSVFNRESVYIYIYVYMCVYLVISCVDLHVLYKFTQTCIHNDIFACGHICICAYT